MMEVALIEAAKTKARVELLGFMARQLDLNAALLGALAEDSEGEKTKMLQHAMATQKRLMERLERLLSETEKQMADEANG